jgi:hypothetical protein
MRCGLFLVFGSTALTFAAQITPVQESYLKAATTHAGDNFGYNVAAFGDTIVIGAPSEASSATGVNGDPSSTAAAASGAAYVFVRDGTNWIQQAYLKASNTGPGDRFGYRVAIWGDTIVVGAPQEGSAATGVNGDGANNGAASSGAAYVFVRDGTNWTQQAYLKASNTGTSDAFGRSVAVYGDTLIVGANGEASSATGVNGNQSDNGAAFSGAAYAFVRNGTNWTQQAYLKASNTGANDSFGMRVSLWGDTAVVTAWAEASSSPGVNGNQNDNSANQAGAAYVFVRSGPTWSQQAYLKASNPGANDFFGVSVALSGDTVAIGAYEEASNATGVNGNQNDNSLGLAGAAYVFVRTGTTWSQQAYIKASNTGANDWFGFSVALAGDTLAVGAPQEGSSATGINGNQADNSAGQAGAVYVFVGNNTNWVQHANV